jgi:hypothetical protein
MLESMCNNTRETKLRRSQMIKLLLVMIILRRLSKILSKLSFLEPTPVSVIHQLMMR